MKQPTFIVFADGITMNTDVSIEQHGKQWGGLLADTPTIGYFTHQDKCVRVILTCSKRGYPYWKEECKANINGIMCRKHQHNHS